MRKVKCPSCKNMTSSGHHILLCEIRRMVKTEGKGFATPRMTEGGVAK